MLQSEEKEKKTEQLFTKHPFSYLPGHVALLSFSVSLPVSGLVT